VYNTGYQEAGVVINSSIVRGIIMNVHNFKDVSVKRRNPLIQVNLTGLPTTK